MPMKALDPAGFRIIVTLLIAMVSSAVYGQSETDFESEFAQPRLIHTADVGEILVVPFAQGLANPFDLAVRAGGQPGDRALYGTTQNHPGGSLAARCCLRRAGCLLGGLSGGTHVGCSASG